MTNNDPTPTPGPWQISESDGTNIYVQDTDSDRSGDHDIASVFDRASNQVQTANARLIATAPQLLEACKAALEEFHCDCDCSTCETCGTRYFLDDAISLAERGPRSSAQK